MSGQFRNLAMFFDIWAATILLAVEYVLQLFSQAIAYSVQSKFGLIETDDFWGILPVPILLDVNLDWTSSHLEIGWKNFVAWKLVLKQIKTNVLRIT